MANTLLGYFRSASAEDPLTDAKAIEIWFRKQPGNDYLATSEAMVRALEDMGARQAKVTPGRVQAVLELDRLSMPIQARLLKQFLQTNLSDSVRQRLWHALDDLARWFAYSYESLFEAMLDSVLGQRTKGHLPAVAARMFHYRGQQAKNALFRYERWVPGKWKGLHAAFEAALTRGIAETPFALTDELPAAEKLSTEQEYILILLLQRINTGNLSALQIERAAQWLNKWAPLVKLSQPPATGGGFWVDLGQGDGLLTRRPMSPQGTLLYLDIESLQREIGSELVDLTLYKQRAGVQDRQVEATERLALLQKLESLWRPQAKLTQRRGIRVAADRPVEVAPGLSEIASALRGSQVDESLVRRFRVGDPVEMASGHVQPAAEEGGIEFNPGGAEAWRMQDASESGAKLVSKSAEAEQQKLGSLLGILDEGQSRWKVAIIRRLKKISGGHIEVGVEIVSHHCLLISPKPVASRKTGYSVDGIDVSAENKNFDALYLPPGNLPGRAPSRSMIVPALEFRERRRLFLTFEETAYTIEFTAALERTKDWVWTSFEVVREAK